MDKATGKSGYKDNIALSILGISRLKLSDLGYIVARNLFLLTNGVIFAVVALLFVFGDKRAALFLGILSVFNVLAGLVQDINAWLALEKLQLLTAPHVLRLQDDGSFESVLTEEIRMGDHIKLKIGDQVPSDSILLEAQSFEINEGLITGESDSIVKNVGDHLLAGSVVTSGTGLVEAETVFHESRIARMTEGIKKYSVNLSPIQKSINIVVEYTGYLLVATIVFIVARGAVVHETNIQIVNNIGTISSVLVPAGLVFAATLFFAYGAAHLFRRQVLLQEVNATEKLGHIENLCMDKTGTLTENVLAVENMHVPENVDVNFAKEMVAAYIQGTDDTTQTIEAIKKHIAGIEYQGKTIETLAFSSWRRYGAIKVKDERGEVAIFVGSPDIFLPNIQNSEEKKWLQELIDMQVRQGKRVLCVMQTKSNETLPHDISKIQFSVLSAFVFRNNLREGIRDAIDFFQNRGVHIRIISGDNPETVKTVAALAGVKDTDNFITGKEMEKWSKADFDEKTSRYTIFARIVPEQKEKIIEALKKEGFTAMIGDGANDALAIKKADLGIAMFDGAPATRQLASVVLMNNSFAALPGGVSLADNVIRNLEIFASIFFDISCAGFFFFIMVNILGYVLPLTPLNMALINYITAGMSGSLVLYWIIIPTGNVRRPSARPFLQRILPFVAWSALIQALGLTTLFLLSPEFLKNFGSNPLVLIAFIVFGFIFFACASGVYTGHLNAAQKKHLGVLFLLEFLILFLVFKTPLVSEFFNINALELSAADAIRSTFVILAVVILQYGIFRQFVFKQQAEGN